MATENPGTTPHKQFLEFERPIIELEDKIAELKQLASVQQISVDDEVQRLGDKATKLRKDIYSKLTPWQNVQLARHHAGGPFAPGCGIPAEVHVLNDKTDVISPNIIQTLFLIRCITGIDAMKCQ